MAIQIPTRLLDGAVLSFLRVDDLYGYALTQKVQSIFDVSESTIYPVLRRLKKDDCLSTYDQPYQGRNRRYYHLTTVGLQLLTDIQDEWQDFSQQMNKVMKETKLNDD
ncbi:PadR family transcriptional regulator [Bombilactobacillus thymidiniphilus]|uniref:PadR family transcriptional regulator n=1 Tax=Bombilactobacillus thymidiniphilus TaxID=2923363 RepID=A0ABY4PBW2_9LACO|nr:PadR family transcriptional regulator [Bombilactobacillus thymidiniphilus]UQS83263.1 PadR family transcriptional regulator [Bombilactobacillus thymidiniphilus]